MPPEPKFLGDVILRMIGAGLSLGTAVFAGILLAFNYPEKCQKWFAIIWGIIVKFWKGAEKKYITHDIEGHVNDFVRRLTKEVPNLKASGVKIEWVTGDDTAEEFFKDDLLVVRLREHRSQAKNFVNATVVFITNSLLPKAKRYMSKSQRLSIDLFVGKKLFEREKPSVCDSFYEDFFAPAMSSNEKIAQLIERFNVIDKTGIFFPVFVQEMVFLGEKVFFGKRDPEIVKEVNDLVDFLYNYSQREVGTETTPTTFRGPYCRCAIVIIATRQKREIGQLQPYVLYIEHLSKERMENIYLIGASTPANVLFMHQVEKALLASSLERYMEKTYDATIKTRSGARRKTKNYLILLRHKDTTRYFDEDYQKDFIEPAKRTTLELSTGNA